MGMTVILDKYDSILRLQTFLIHLCHFVVVVVVVVLLSFKLEAYTFLKLKQIQNSFRVAKDIYLHSYCIVELHNIIKSRACFSLAYYLSLSKTKIAVFL